MGPRSVDRGISVRLAEGLGILGASMGPRSVDRGIPKGQHFTLCACPLQWGRDQLIAEFCRCHHDADQHWLLQWGRDQLIAELHDVRPLHGCSEWLQWGRDQLIAEFAPPPFAPCVSIVASMGPRSVDRGIAWPREFAAKPHPCFNGAAIS